MSRAVSGVVLVFRDNTKRRKASGSGSSYSSRSSRRRAQAEIAKERLAFSPRPVPSGFSLDYATTLESVARLDDHRLADWCSIGTSGRRRASLQRVAVVHKDASKVEAANARPPPLPSRSERRGGVFTVLRTGRSQLLPDISDAMLEAAARDRNTWASCVGWD